MRTCTCATTKTSRKPELALAATLAFTTRGNSTSPLDTGPPMKFIMPRKYRGMKSGRRRAPPMGGRRPSFGGRRALCPGPARHLEVVPSTAPNKGILPVFFLNGKCWKSMSYEVNKFNKKHCLDKWVHYTGSDSKIGRCQGGALILGQAKPATKQLNPKGWAMQADPKSSGCPTPAEPIFESRAVYTPPVHRK